MTVPPTHEQVTRGPPRTHLEAEGGAVAALVAELDRAPGQVRAGAALDLGPDALGVQRLVVVGLHEDLRTVLTAHRTSRTAYRRVQQNVALAFLFNGVGIPLAATGFVYPVWAMAAMAASVTTIFVNSLGARPRLLLAAISAVGRRSTRERPPVVAS